MPSAANFTLEKMLHGFRRDVSRYERFADVARQDKGQFSRSNLFVLRHQPKQILSGRGIIRNVTDSCWKTYSPQMRCDTVCPAARA